MWVAVTTTGGTNAESYRGLTAFLYPELAAGAALLSFGAVFAALTFVYWSEEYGVGDSDRSCMVS